MTLRHGPEDRGDNFIGSEDDTVPLLSDAFQLPRSYSREEIVGMDSRPKLLPQYVAAFCATVGAVSMGAVLGYSSPAGVILAKNTTDSDIVLSKVQISWFSSSCNLGALLGTPIAGLCINIFGRRGTMIYSLAPFLLGWGLIIAAQNFAMLMIGRIITGACCGLVSLSVPTYIGEYSSPSIRGMLGSGFQLMVVIGLLFAFCMGAVFDSWRWIAATCAIFPCIFSVLMIFAKESPIFLLSKGRNQDAKIAMDFFRGNRYQGTYKEIEVMKEALERKQQYRAKLSDLKTPYIMKPLFISIGLFFFQQFSGINAVLFNLETIFEAAGSNLSASVSSIIVALVQVIATLIGSLLMDKAGRKLLLVLSASFMLLTLASLGVYFYLQTFYSDLVQALGLLPLCAIIIFIFAFSVGYGPVPWLMMGEVFSPNVKELTASLATLINWLFAFVTTVSFIPLQAALNDYGVYWMFASFTVLNLLFIFIFVYETKGKTLEEICAHFGAPAASSPSSPTNSNAQSPH